MNERLKTHSKTQKKSADLVSNKLRIGVFQRYQMKCKSVSKKSPRYTKTAAVLAPLGVSVTGIHSVVDPVAAIENAEIVIVGGGNTFQLLKQCRERGLLAPITDVVKRGALYIGWSAGANLACPTIRTTNDMPIVDPQGFDALNLFPLQINPHFTNALPEGHKGETREQRIRELLVVAPELTIIGLPEGNWITVSKGHATLGGPNTTYVFKAGEEAVPLEAGHRF